MSFKSVNRIVIAGVGLIGGSVGMALKLAGFKGEIIGLGRRWSSLKIAIDAGAVSSATMDPAEALADADLLLISTPVDIIPAIARDAVKYARAGCVITDVGSTKGQIVDEIESFIPRDIHFVGAHPMAGSHKTGVNSADPSLFKRSLCIITPTEHTGPEAVSLVSELWKMIDARVELMSPQEHDFLIAAASHLPHAAACALIQVVAGVKAINYTSTGFLDTTRIASGDPKIWKGILLQNADMASSMLKKLENELAEMRKALENRDEAQLTEKLERAKQIRDSLR